MADATFYSQLASLEATAKTLNDSSNSLNAVLTAFEKRLVTANIGFEVWLPQPLSRKEGKKERGAEQVTIERHLGFARVHGVWCLAVKEVRTRFGFFEGDTNCPWSDEHLEESPFSLGDASREERIKALQFLSALVQTLDEEAKKAIQVIEDAKRLVY